MESYNKRFKYNVWERTSIQLILYCSYYLCYLFKTYCSNLYCAPLWCNFTLTAMKKIKIAYNNSIRRLFFLPKHNSASEMCVNLNIMSFGELLRKYVYSFRFRLGASLNCIIDNIYSSNVPLHSLFS